MLSEKAQRVVEIASQIKDLENELLALIGGEETPAKSRLEPRQKRKYTKREKIDEEPKFSPEPLDVKEPFIPKRKIGRPSAAKTESGQLDNEILRCNSCGEEFNYTGNLSEAACVCCQSVNVVKTR